MLSRSQLRICVAAATLGLILSSLTAGAQEKGSYRGRKYKAPPPTARVTVTVLRDVDGKPIERAAVIFHPVQGERDKGGMELKTNEDGKTMIDVLPIGDTVRLQIIAKGFQTYGGDFKVEKNELAFEIRMKRPGEQYSIYKDHIRAAEKSPDAGKPANPPAPDSGKDAGSSDPASKDKPAQSSDQPSQSQSTPK